MKAVNYLFGLLGALTMLLTLVEIFTTGNNLAVGFGVILSCMFTSLFLVMEAHDNSPRIKANDQLEERLRKEREGR